MRPKTPELQFGGSSSRSSATLLRGSSGLVLLPTSGFCTSGLQGTSSRTGTATTVRGVHRRSRARAGGEGRSRSPAVVRPKRRKTSASIQQLSGGTVRDGGVPPHRGFPPLGRAPGVRDDRKLQPGPGPLYSIPKLWAVRPNRTCPRQGCVQFGLASPPAAFTHTGVLVPPPWPATGIPVGQGGGEGSSNR